MVAAIPGAAGSSERIGIDFMNERIGIDYGRFMARAMRGVMAEVLGHVAENGLPGDHHFYITFDTTHPGVDLPGWLVERYPEEMTIVMQDWYDDLAVMGDRFRVTLNFSNRPETLVIPFDAVSTFVDPSVRFGLKFDDHEPEEAGEFQGAPEQAEAKAEAEGEEEPQEDRGSADVVSLDTFRKPGQGN